MGFKAITHNYSVIVQRLLCIAQVFFRFCFSILRSKINVLCGDQRRVGQSDKPAARQSKAARQVGDLFADDVVVSEFFLISLNVFDVNSNSDRFARKKNEAVDQAVGRLRAHEGLVPLVVLFNVLVGKALYLLVCQLHADGNNTNCSAGRLGFQQIHCFCDRKLLFSHLVCLKPPVFNSKTQRHMGGEARTQHGKTFAHSASKSAFCILPWRVRLRNRRIWLSWFWLMGCKKERSPPC